MGGGTPFSKSMEVKKASREEWSQPSSSHVKYLVVMKGVFYAEPTHD